MGHRGIPAIPVDGTQYSSVGLLGLPLVLEYDETTGGFKLVVSTEAGVTLNISGTVSLEAGDIEIGAVEIKNRDSDDRAIVDAQGRLYTRAFVTGSVSIDNAVAQYNPVLPAQYAEDSAHASGQTGTFVMAVRQDTPSALAGEGNYSPFLTDLLGRLHIFTSGSFVTLSSA